MTHVEHGPNDLERGGPGWGLFVGAIAPGIARAPPIAHAIAGFTCDLAEYQGHHFHD